MCAQLTPQHLGLTSPVTKTRPPRRASLTSRNLLSLVYKDLQFYVWHVLMSIQKVKVLSRRNIRNQQTGQLEEESEPLRDTNFTKMCRKIVMDGAGEELNTNDGCWLTSDEGPDSY